MFEQEFSILFYIYKQKLYCRKSREHINFDFLEYLKRLVVIFLTTKNNSEQFK